MKKTILAMAVPALLAAGAVNAATVYDQDGVTVSIGGAAEVQLIQNYEFEGEDKNLDVRLDDGELNFGVDVAVNDSLTALGYFDFENEKGSVKNTELWAGFKGDFGQVTAGRMYTFWDDTNIGEDIEFGLEGFDDFGVGAPAHGENVVKYRFENDTFWFGVAHDLEGDYEAEYSATDAGIGASFAGVDLAAYYTTSELENYDTDGFQVSAVYNMDAFTFGASYTSLSNGWLEIDDVNYFVDDEVDTDYVELLFGFASGDFQYYLGYNFGEIDAGNGVSSDISNVYANATYKMHSNVKTYVELGWAEIDPNGGKSDDATGFLAGVEVKF